jgi:type IV fimbrial biogenesis protein FimT
MARRSQRGFNLIELMVTLTVLAVLITLGVPSFSDWLQTQRIRSAAEAIVNGMQIARGEAIKQNQPVVLGLEPGLGTGWTVCPATVAPCDSTTPAPPAPNSYIQQKGAQEGTGNAFLTASATPSPQPPVPATLVTFSPLGAALPKNLDGSQPVVQVDVYYNDPALCSANGGTMRCLRVVVTAGGNVRMCDPTPGVVAPDPRACP